MMAIGRLHVITDTTVQDRCSHAELALLAVRGGADTIQYRSKCGDVRRMIAEAADVRDVCRAANVLFVVNDRLDVCLAIGADGVHLGREDMPLAAARRVLGARFVVGGTVRNAAQLAEAARDGADYVGLGPVFTTMTKDVGHAPLGLEGVAAVAQGAAIPVVAIAGIGPADVVPLLRAGAFGVAVIGAVAGAADPTAATAEFARGIAEALLA